MDEMQAHEVLRGSMLKEIDLMREMLSSLLQEESFLRSKDKESWFRLMQDRKEMVEQLKLSRTTRESMKRILSDQPVLDEGLECEISLLSNQLVALTDKAHQQHIRNQELSDRIQNGSYIYDGVPCLSVLYSDRPVKKASLITLQEPEALESE